MENGSSFTQLQVQFWQGRWIFLLKGFICSVTSRRCLFTDAWLIAFFFMPVDRDRNFWGRMVRFTKLLMLTRWGPKIWKLGRSSIRSFLFYPVTASLHYFTTLGTPVLLSFTLLCYFFPSKLLSSHLKDYLIVVPWGCTCIRLIISLAVLWSERFAAWAALNCQLSTKYICMKRWDMLLMW